MDTKTIFVNCRNVESEIKRIKIDPKKRVIDLKIELAKALDVNQECINLYSNGKFLDLNDTIDTVDRNDILYYINTRRMKHEKKIEKDSIDNKIIDSKNGIDNKMEEKINYSNITFDIVEIFKRISENVNLYIEILNEYLKNNENIRYLVTNDIAHELFNNPICMKKFINVIIENNPEIIIKLIPNIKKINKTEEKKIREKNRQMDLEEIYTMGFDKKTVDEIYNKYEDKETTINELLSSYQ